MPVMERFAPDAPESQGTNPVERMAHRLHTQAGRALYSLRKQTVEPVLIAGAGPVERVNHGTLGRTVVLVPCTQALAVDGACASGCSAEALQTWWWLAPTLPQVLPEQLDGAAIALARAQLPEGAVRTLTSSFPMRRKNSRLPASGAAAT